MSSPLLLLAVREGLLALLVVGPARSASSPVFNDAGVMMRSGDAGARARVEARVLEVSDIGEVQHTISWWGARGCRWAAPTARDREALLALLPHDEDDALVAGDVRLPEASRGRAVRADQVTRDGWPEAALVVEGMARAVERHAPARATARRAA